MKSTSKVAIRWLAAFTTEMPKSFAKSEPGLMTVDEFIRFRNPEDKHHESGTYDFDLVKMNQDYSLVPVGKFFSVFPGGDGVTVMESHGDFLLRRQDENHTLVGIVHDGTLYHDKWVSPERLDAYYSDTERKYVDLPIKRTKVVKYLQDYVSKVDHVARQNLDKYSNLIQQIKVGDEYMSVRSEKKPKLNEGTTIVILNSSGYVVAQASNEWGATLLTVAQEYRGHKLGKVIGKLWYEWNPDFSSGGFTPQGEANAVSLWKDRVREFMARGWYSELVHRGDLTVGRVKEILAGVGARPKDVLAPAVKTKAPDVLVMIDEGSYFYIYDRAFLTEQDEKYIYGFGFFRDSGDKTFLFRIDYERKFSRLANTIALQMARDMHEDIYIGSGYGDTLELEGIDHVEVEGDFVRLTEDVLDLRAFAAVERAARRKVDQYDEAKMSLMEMADAKDW